MTLQEAFTKMVLHMRQQKAASRLPNGTCAYRGQANQMCAVGCLIKDEHYKPSLESQGVRSKDVIDALKLSGVGLTNEDSWVLLDVQKIHDNYFVESWNDKLAHIANLYKLEMPA